MIPAPRFRRTLRESATTDRGRTRRSPRTRARETQSNPFSLRDFGVHNIKMPATPYSIWKTIQDAKKSMSASMPAKTGAKPGRT